LAVFREVSSLQDFQSFFREKFLLLLLFRGFPFFFISSTEIMSSKQRAGKEVMIAEKNTENMKSVCD